MEVTSLDSLFAIASAYEVSTILIWKGIVELYDVFGSIWIQKNPLSPMRKRQEYVIILFRYIYGIIMNILLLDHNLYFNANFE